MIDFTFIIPVYNAEETIERCLDSIKAQQYYNFEVIIMDDGSSDKSYEKCIQYQKQDRRFKVYHQENAGPSVARNACIDYAKGKWICFIDSDDTISECYLNCLYQKIQEENPDVIFIGYEQINTMNETMETKLPGIIKGEYHQILEGLSLKDMFGYTWIKSFKRESVGDNRFNVNLNLFEDEVFTCNVLENCHKVSILNKPIYHYYIGSSNALTQKTHQDYCKKCNEVFEAWERFLEKSEFSSEILRNKAEIFVERCRYYGLERRIKIEEFYTDLAETRYFSLINHGNKFSKYVLDRNFKMLKLEKIIYNCKITIAEKLKLLKHIL